MYTEDTEKEISEECFENTSQTTFMNSDFFTHDTDKMALKALKAIPLFDQLLKAFMNYYNERILHIINMATNLRLSEKQLSKYYKMLPPICGKLGIEIPELYLTDSVIANAYTSGDTKPFIVITKGLLETVPNELIPTILAHECGHIACHHVLYDTLARILLNAQISNLVNNPILEGLGDIISNNATILIIKQLKYTFAYWQRCSELSADRAAAICDGTTENVVKMCMYFAGYDKDIETDANIDEFVNQALDYKKLLDNEKLNKIMEISLSANASHPLNAVRALEIIEYGKTENFQKLVQYVNTPNNEISLSEYLHELPMPQDAKYYLSKNISDVLAEIRTLGFTNIKTLKITQKGILSKEGQVTNIRINGKDGFDMCEWYDIDSEVLIEYYASETNNDVLNAHPNQVRIPNSTKYYLGKLYIEVISELEKCGFINIEVEEQQKNKKKLLAKNGEIFYISINGQTQFSKNEWFDKNATIKVIYYTYEK